MKTYLTLAELAASNLKGNYSSRIAENKTVLDDLSKFVPCSLKVSAVTFNRGMHDEYTDVDQFHVFIDGTYISVYKRDDKYKFWDQRYHFVKNIHNTDKISIKSKILAPNEVGVLSKKKIDDWVKYWDCVMLRLNEKSEENTKNIADFKASLVDIVFNHVREDVSNEYEKGYAYLNGLRYEYEISHGSISQKLELDYVPSTVENFKALADNKYKKVIKA